MKEFIEGMEIDITRKNIKNIYIRVKGEEVKVTAPYGASEEYVRYFINTKKNWILKNKRTKVTQKIESGETHFVFGEQYLMDINICGENKVNIIDGNLCISLRDYEKREGVLNSYYKKILYDEMLKMIPNLEKALSVSAKGWKIRRMKSRWGSCNTRTGNITINLELAKKPKKCLEYVMVHELVHLMEPSHNSRFKGLMDNYYPNWREIKKELNKI